MYRGERRDLTLRSKRGALRCSHFIPSGARSADGRLPCVVYCHCNSGSRRDAEEAVYLLLPMGVTVFAFDFTARRVFRSLLLCCRRPAAALPPPCARPPIAAPPRPAPLAANAC